MNTILRLDLFNAYNGFCQCSQECVEKATDLHHIKPNTKVNKKKFPLYLNSPFNLKPWNNGCHLNKPLPKEPSDKVCQVFEDWLGGEYEKSN